MYVIPHLNGLRRFVEPCAGDGALIDNLESFGLQCVAAYDIEPRCRIDTYERCQGGVLSEIDGVGLCGTHINALGADDPILVLRELTLPPKG